MKICIEGCAHGDLDRIYMQIEQYERNTGCKVDLLICCGDFQATRNLDDLACMAVPPKYLEMCSFYKYHQGERVAPVLTIFIGGNHEASNHLQELAYGGWVATNIYYLGYAGVVQVNGIRIGGISGIYRGYNYEKGHHEITPYNDDTVRSVYSIRKSEVFKLRQLTPGKMDILLSHDWPSFIWEHGDNSRTGTKEGLLRLKPAFKQDMDSGRLGSKPCWDLLTHLKPRFWFAAHMHCRFDALVKHDDESLATKFVALDKCLPRRHFFEFIELGDIVTRDEDGKAQLKFEYDPEWLTILKLTNNLLNCTPQRTMLPMEPRHNTSGDNVKRWNFNPTPEEIAEVVKSFGDLKIPQNFKQIAHGFDPQFERINVHHLMKPQPVLNPQTKEFCDRLNIDDPLLVVASLMNIDIEGPNVVDPEKAFKEVAAPQRSSLSLPKPINSEEIDLDSFDDETDESAIDLSSNISASDTSLIQSPAVCIKRSTSVEEKPASPKSPVVPSANLSAKKFKRRNQELREDDD